MHPLVVADNGNDMTNGRSGRPRICVAGAPAGWTQGAATRPARRSTPRDRFPGRRTTSTYDAWPRARGRLASRPRTPEDAGAAPAAHVRCADARQAPPHRVAHGARGRVRL